MDPWDAQVKNRQLSSQAELPAVGGSWPSHPGDVEDGQGIDIPDTTCLGLAYVPISYGLRRVNLCDHL